MGIALGVKNLLSKDNLEEKFERICRVIHDTRPTAQNLFWAPTHEVCPESQTTGSWKISRVRSIAQARHALNRLGETGRHSEVGYELF